jgi:3-oxoacyl-[acyl-carrier-protein] synthase II
MNDVAVTGIGIVSPFGAGKDTWISAFKSNFPIKKTKIPEFQNTPLANQEIATLPDLLKVAQQKLDRKLIKFMSDATMLGCLAGKEAAEDASIAKRFASERIGIYAATGLTAANFHSAAEMLKACTTPEETFSEKLFGKAGLSCMNPLESFKILPNMPPCILAILLGIKGPNLILNKWEGQAGAAIYEGFLAVRTSEVDCALVGGADTPASPATIVSLRQRKLMGENEFPSDAGAYLVLESRDRAVQDGRYIYAIIQEIMVQNTSEKMLDPLAPQIGRTYASAPPLLLASHCLKLTSVNQITDGCGISFSFHDLKQ